MQISIFGGIDLFISEGLAPNLNFHGKEMSKSKESLT